MLLIIQGGASVPHLIHIWYMCFDFIVLQLENLIKE
jgi:hypothetical protein